MTRTTHIVQLLRSASSVALWLSPSLPTPKQVRCGDAPREEVNYCRNNENQGLTLNFANELYGRVILNQYPLNGSRWWKLKLYYNPVAMQLWGGAVCCQETLHSWAMSSYIGWRSTSQLGCFEKDNKTLEGCALKTSCIRAKNPCMVF